MSHHKEKPAKTKIKQIVDLETGIAWIEKFIADLRQGELVLETDENSMVLNAPQTMEIKAEAKIKQDKEKFSLEIEWKTTIASDEQAAGEDEADSSLEETEEASDTEAESEEDAGEEASDTTEDADEAGAANEEESVDEAMEDEAGTVESEDSTPKPLSF